MTKRSPRERATLIIDRIDPFAVWVVTAAAIVAGFFMADPHSRVVPHDYWRSLTVGGTPLVFIAHQEYLRGMTVVNGKHKIDIAGRRKRFWNRVFTAAIIGFLAGVGAAAL